MLIRILIAVLILALIAAGVILFLRFRNRKQQESAAAPPPPPKDPEKAKRIAQLRSSLSALFSEELRQLDQNVGGAQGR